MSNLTLQDYRHKNVEFWLSEGQVIENNGKMLHIIFYSQQWQIQGFKN